MRRQANETGESTAVPITVRQLEAIVRLSESLAKMRLEVTDLTISNVANDNDVQEAIRIFNNSTMDATKSGLNQHINLTPEMANEIKIGWSRALFSSRQSFIYIKFFSLWYTASGKPNKEKNGNRKPFIREKTD
ncbi:putative DNA helicase [Helianthus annuus]|nr:putative DNA helicase [Helianthus annuus]